MSEKLFDVSGKNALITGASRGIGFALARGLGRAGARLILNGRNEETLDAAVVALAKEGLVAKTCAFDVTSHVQIGASIAELEAGGTQIDILINNAGMQHRAPLQEFQVDKFDQIIATNLRSVFSVSQAVAKPMIERKAGKILNIASVMSLLARPSIAPYTASKGAVSSLTKAMAADWAQYGLNCNAIAPGFIETEMTAKLDADTVQGWRDAIPLKRGGTPEDVANLCVFLASDMSAYITGQTLNVDGGMITA